jgi:anti-sigma-K factor RskA
VTDDRADVHTLSGAYAAGAVDDVEGAAFERHLALCAACRTEVRELRETLVRLAEASAVTPPNGLKPSVMDRIRVTAQEPPRQGAGIVVPRARGVRTPWLVAAGFAVLAAGAGAVAWEQHVAADGAHQLAAVVADPAAQRATGPAAHGGSVTVVRVGDRAAVLASGMPGLPSGRTYQLWIVRPGSVTSAGLGPAAPSAGGDWSRLVSGVRPGDVVAVSVEPAGGSRQPSTAPVVALKA